MKIYFFFFLLILPLVMMSQNELSEKEEIRKVLQMQEDAWNNGDMHGYMSGYWKSDSLVFVGKNGLQKGWQTTLDGYLKGYPDKAAMGKLTFGIKKIELLSPISAFVLGSWLLSYPNGSSKGGMFSLLFRMIDGKWVIVADHSS